jgi:uncharacterized protein (DUF427 family)
MQYFENTFHHVLTPYLGNDTYYNVLPRPCVITEMGWVKANIVEDKMLEIDCEVFGGSSKVHYMVMGFQKYIWPT